MSIAPHPVPPHWPQPWRIRFFPEKGKHNAERRSSDCRAMGQSWNHRGRTCRHAQKHLFIRFSDDEPQRQNLISGAQTAVVFATTVHKPTMVYPTEAWLSGRKHPARKCPDRYCTACFETFVGHLVPRERQNQTQSSHGVEQELSRHFHTRFHARGVVLRRSRCPLTIGQHL